MSVVIFANGCNPALSWSVLTRIKIPLGILLVLSKGTFHQEEFKIGFFSEGVKMFAQIRWWLSEQHHRVTIYKPTSPFKGQSISSFQTTIWKLVPEGNQKH